MAKAIYPSARGATQALAIALLLAANDGDAYNLYALGGPDGNPWSAALSAAPGDYVVAGRDGLGTERNPVRTPTTFPTWRDTLAVAVDSVGGPWLRPFFVPDTLNLAQDGVRNRVGRGIFNNIAVSGCNNIASAVVVIRPMFDGDPKTASFFGAGDPDDPQIQQAYVQNSIVDLGTDYPVNRVRFFPRLGRDNPKLDRVLAEMAPPKLSAQALGEQDYSQNALPWFEVSAAGSVANFAGHCFWTSSTSPWFQPISRSDSEPDPRLTVLRRELENLDTVVDFRFPTRPLQWIAFRPLNPVANWEVAEFQVFGEGHVPRAVYTTAVLDFGEPMAWGRIRWRGDLDPQARLTLRTRSGSDPDPDRYWVPTTIPGVDREISRQEYERADIVSRTTTHDLDHWSFWSAPYPWEAGLRDASWAPQAWTDGTPIRSPGPARYLQLQVVFESSPSQAPRLQDLEVQFDRPSAARVVAEIWPLDASRTEATTFTYSVRPTLQDGQGFDRLEVFTLTRVDTIRSARVDGAQIDAARAVQILPDRFLLSLPRLRGAADSFKLIEVEFDAHVVRYGTQFDGWVFASDGGGVRQLVEAGDATVEFPGNSLGVRTGDLGESLLASVSATPNPFTPNGDGINDDVSLRFGVHELSAPRPLSIDIHALSGRRVRQLYRQTVVRGVTGDDIPTPVWDGRDDAGRLVPPGVYLYRIRLDVDGSPQVRLGSLFVAY